MVSLAEKELSRIHTENRLIDKQTGFTAAFLGVQHIESHICSHPETISKKTVLAVLSIIRSTRFTRKKQAYFLYRQAAFSLIRISMDPAHPLAGFLIVELQEIILSGTGVRQRAVSEALGALPLKLTGPQLDPWNESRLIHISFDELTGCHKSRMDESCWQGRTLVVPVDDQNKCCIKFLKSGQSLDELAREAQWLTYLNTDLSYDTGSRIPVPLRIKKKTIFKIKNLPASLCSNKQICSDHIAISFIAPVSYFHYPNDPGVFRNPHSSLIKVFGDNALRLGKLSAAGIVHTALIPLFHNRVQQDRRQDQGIYNWEQGGRLDQWLESSQYPNFARSGLRDFEHLESIYESRELRHFIGQHILSFILVAGSFFRNRQPDQKGMDANGTPKDLTGLFDPALFAGLIHTITEQYYMGITGFELESEDLMPGMDLIEKLICSMGVDRHMEESLRVHDQENMNDEQFSNFLIQRGVEENTITQMTRGKQDIILQTGPHLGGFNQPICVPELIDFLFCFSSMCISDCYLNENGLKAYLN